MEERLAAYKLVHLDQNICEIAMNLVGRFKFSKAMNYPDALIAATCVEKDFMLYTLNRRHFDFITELRVI